MSINRQQILKSSNPIPNPKTSRRASVPRQFAGRTVGKRAGLQVHLDVAAVQVAPNELFRQRILDIALDGAPERPGAVRAVLARHLDDPADDVRRQRDLQLAIDEVLVQLR